MDRSIIGSGVEAFTELSTSVLDVWLAAVSALSDSDDLSVNGREMSLSALREFLESASVTDQSALDAVDPAKLKKGDDEDDDDEDGGVLSWLMSKGASMLLPAPIKAGLALLELVKSVGSAAVWGLLLWSMDINSIVLLHHPIVTLKTGRSVREPSILFA